MAGFFTPRSLDRGPKSFLDNIQRNIRHLSILGMKWDEKVIKQSKAIGITEMTEDSMYSLYGQHQLYSGADINQKEFIAFFDKEYPLTLSLEYHKFFSVSMYGVGLQAVNF